MKKKYSKLITLSMIVTILFCWLLPAESARNIQDNHQVIYQIVDLGGNHVTGQTVTLQIKRMSDNFWFDFNDSTFKNAGWTNKTTNLSEDSTDGFYYYLFNPPASETGAEEYQFLVDNGDSTYGDHQSDQVAYQNIGTSTIVAADNIGVNWADITNPTSSQTLSGTTIGTVTNVTTVNGIAADVITAAAIAASAITSSEAPNLDAAVSTRSTVTTAQVNTEVDTALSDIKLDKLLNATATLSSDVALASVMGQLLDAGTAWSYDRSTDSLEAIRDRGDAAWITATGFSTHSAADVWAVATRSLTILDEDSTTIDINGTTIGTVTNVSDKTGYSLSAAGVDVIWDEVQSGHTTAGTFGKYLDAQVSTVGGGSLTAAGIADAVWDEAISGHLTAGTTGKKLSLMPSNLNVGP